MAQLTHLLKHRTQPVGPGDVLTHDILPALKLSQRAAAKKAGMTKNRMHQICAGDRAVTADTAVRFAATFNTTPEFWLNLQATVDLWKAAKNLQRANARRRNAAH